MSTNYNVLIAGASNSVCVRGVAGAAPDGQCAVPRDLRGGEPSRHAQRSSQSTRHLQRSLLPQDLQLREHEEGGEDRRGRSAQHKALTRRGSARGSDAARRRPPGWLSTRLQHGAELQAGSARGSNAAPTSRLAQHAALTRRGEHPAGMTKPS